MYCISHIMLSLGEGRTTEISDVLRFLSQITSSSTRYMYIIMNLVYYKFNVINLYHMYIALTQNINIHVHLHV